MATPVIGKFSTARNVCTPKPDSLVSHNPLEVANPYITGKTSSVGGSV